MLWLMNALKSAIFVQSYDGRNLIEGIYAKNVLKLQMVSPCVGLSQKPACKSPGKFESKSYEAKCRRIQIFF